MAWKGKQTHLEIVDAETGDWGHISIDQIQFSHVGPGLSFYPEGHPFFGNLSLECIGCGGLWKRRF